MSILPQVATLMLKEHKYAPITGDVLLIGRQTVMFGETHARGLLQAEKISIRNGFLREVDADGRITDRSLFSMFTDANVLALDVSPYEGAEVIHDLNTPLDEKYRHIADFIFNGSCLDNLSDPQLALKSMSKMLRPGGRIFHIESGTPTYAALLCYSPEWFFNFYAVNDYADCQMLICSYRRNHFNPWTVSLWRPFFLSDGREEPSWPNPQVGDFTNVIIAEKGANSTDDRTAIQAHYRAAHNEESNIFVRKHRTFAQSKRTYSFESHYRVRPSIKRGARRILDYFGFHILPGTRHRYRITRKVNPNNGLTKLGTLPHSWR
jgi:SAM-dependent methyltransferase